jgi:hypothetical protein
VILLFVFIFRILIYKGSLAHQSPINRQILCAGAGGRPINIAHGVGGGFHDDSAGWNRRPLGLAARPSIGGVQPQREPSMNVHLYHVGEQVALTPHSGTYLKASNAYVVSAQLPPLGDTLQYRIKCASEPYERVVAEHQLNRLDAAAKALVDAEASPAGADEKPWARRSVHAAPAVAPRDRAHSRSR